MKKNKKKNEKKQQQNKTKKIAKETHTERNLEIERKHIIIKTTETKNYVIRALRSIYRSVRFISSPQKLIIHIFCTLIGR